MVSLVKAATGGKLLLPGRNLKVGYTPLPPPKPPAPSGYQPLPPPTPPVSPGGYQPLPPPTPPMPGTMPYPDVPPDPDPPPSAPEYPTPLTSQLVLSYDSLVDKRYTDCATKNASHIYRGLSGEYIYYLKRFVIMLHNIVTQDATLAVRVGLLDFKYVQDPTPDTLATYTAQFASTVANFKGKHAILGAGQTVADDIVGIKTMLAIDQFYARLEDYSWSPP